MSGAPAPLGGSLPAPIDYTDAATFRAARRQWEECVQCDKAMNASERLVVLRVATFAGPDAPAWPSAETVAANLGLSARQVKRGLARGRERGWLLRLGRRAFGGSMRYVLSADPTVAGEIANRLEGERIIRQIRRENPELRRGAVGATRVPVGDGDGGKVTAPHKGRRCPLNGATRVPSLGPPVSRDPTQGTYPSNPEEEATDEVVGLGQHKPEPRAAQTSARATGAMNGTDAVHLSDAFAASIDRLGELLKAGK